MINIRILCFATALAVAKPFFATQDSIEATRILEIASWLPDTPRSISPSYLNRSVWETLGATPDAKKLLATINQRMRKGVAEFDSTAYIRSAQTGNRTLSEKMMEGRFDYLFQLVMAEAIENKNRYTSEIEKTIISLCLQKTWVLAAHDRKLKTFNGEEQYVDLVVATFGFGLAESLAILHDKISLEVRSLVLKKLDERLFAPIRKCHNEKKYFNWFTATHNWNSVCLSGLVGAANAVVLDKQERSLYIALAEKFHIYSLNGFEDDGYCGEGVGYYSYGFRALLTLRESMCRATDGKIDIFDSPKLNQIAQYGHRIQIINNIHPLYADARPGAAISPFMKNYCNRALGFSKEPESIVFPTEKNFALNLIGAFPNQSWRLQITGFEKAKNEKLRSFFPFSNVYTGRPEQIYPKALGVSFKINHNGEVHNHNDVASYTVVKGKEIMAGDQGCPITYPGDWWGKDCYQKYQSKGSYGHPVPLIDGKQQKEGKKATALLIEKSFTNSEDRLTYDLRPVYDLKNIIQLTRTFIYNRKANTFTLIDHIETSTPVSFCVPITTRATVKFQNNEILLEKGREQLRCLIESSSPYSIVNETIEENAPSYQRVGINSNEISTRHTIKVVFTAP